MLWTRVISACIITLLRWGVAARLFRDGQSSRRKEISRLSGIKCETIALQAVVILFYKWMAMKAWTSWKVNSISGIGNAENMVVLGSRQTIVMIITIITRAILPRHIGPTRICNHQDYYALNVPHSLPREQNSAINAGRRLRQKQTVPVVARSCLSLQPFAENAGTNVDERHIFKDRAIRSNT
jgi:hypothetical protein